MKLCIAAAGSPRIGMTSKETNSMVQLLRSTSIACAALVMAAVGTPTLADEYVTNLGPVGPNEPIVAAFGEQRVIAFFVPQRGSCAVHTFMWKDAGADAPYTTSRVRLSLRPGQMARFDDMHVSMNLLCGEDASTLAIVAPPELITRSAAND
jgi:hypothetical protein